MSASGSDDDKLRVVLFLLQMDIGDSNDGDIVGFGGGEVKRPRTLPDDLPKSLDDRKNVSSHYTPETEMYDAWQGR